MTAKLEILIDEEPAELSVPMMMDLLDRIHQNAAQEEIFEEFAEAIDDAMCVLAELQNQAFEVMEEVECEKRLYGDRYVALKHKVC